MKKIRLKVKILINEGLRDFTQVFYLIKFIIQSTKMLVLEAVRVLREIDRTLYVILSQMKELAKGLKEYGVVREMPGVGDTLAPRLKAEIGDVQRFKNGKSLVAYAGLMHHLMNQVHL